MAFAKNTQISFEINELNKKIILVSGEIISVRDDVCYTYAMLLLCLTELIIYQVNDILPSEESGIFLSSHNHQGVGYKNSNHSMDLPWKVIFKI